jgi:hypothetical protein
MLTALGRVLAALLISSLFAATASAQQDKTSDVAKKSQNPISDLISFPVQENVNFQCWPSQQDPERDQHPAGRSH